MAAGAGVLAHGRTSGQGFCHGGQPSFEGFVSMSVPRRIAAFLDLAAQDADAARTLAKTKNRYAEVVTGDRSRWAKAFALGLG